MSDLITNSTISRSRKSVVSWTDFKWLAFAIIFMLLSVLAFKVRNPMWFERSGSVVVLLSAISEYDLNRKIRKSNEYRDGPISMHRQALAANLTIAEKTLLLASHSMIIIGTLLWGYGWLLL